MAKIGTLSDNFDDNVIDTVKWTAYSFGGASVAESGQQLLFTNIAGASNYATLQTAADYDFTESNIAVRVLTVQDQHLSHENYFITTPSTENPQDTQNYEGWYISNGSIRAAKKVAGATTFMASAAYSATTHAWIRLRHAGSLLYFDTAPSTASNPPIESDWVNFHSTTPARAMTALRLQFQAGAYDATNGGDTGTWDSLHSTSSGVSVTLTGLESVGAVGTTTQSGKATAPVTGVQATGAVGEVTQSSPMMVTVDGFGAVSALGVTTQAGTCNVVLAGLQAVSALGVTTQSGKASVALTGLAGTASVGITTQLGHANVLLTGLQAEATTGAPPLSGSTPAAPVSVKIIYYAPLAANFFASVSVGEVSIIFPRHVSVEADSLRAQTEFTPAVAFAAQFGIIPSLQSSSYVSSAGDASESSVWKSVPPL